MKGILIILLFFTVSTGFGQTVQIDTLLVKTTHYLGEDYILKLPIIKTKDENIERKINEDFQMIFFGDVLSKDGIPIDIALLKWADENIVYLDFEITYNQKGVLSFNIKAEGCGANCNAWTEYYNYSIETGDLLTVRSIYDFPGSVDKKIIEKFSQAKNELDEIYSEEDTELQNWALKEYEECEQFFETVDMALLVALSLYENHLKIIYTCSFPRFIRNSAPYIELKYDYKDINQYLKFNFTK